MGRWWTALLALALGLGQPALADPPELEAYATERVVVRHMVKFSEPANPAHIPEVRDEWWAMYRDKAELDVPGFLEAVDATEQRADLERELRRLRRKSGLLYLLAGVGATASAAGIVGVDTLTGNRLHARGNRSLISGGLLVTFGAAIGAAFPHGRTFRLKRRPLESMTLTRLESLAEAHNERLRLRLGLSPEQVRALDPQERLVQRPGWPFPAVASDEP